MESKIHFSVLMFLAGISFVLAASRAVPSYAAEGTSTEPEVGVAHNKTIFKAKRRIRLIKHPTAKRLPVSVRRNVASAPSSACAPCEDRPVVTWSILAGTGSGSRQYANGAEQPQRFYNVNSAAQPGPPPSLQAPPMDGSSPGGYWYSEWVSCSTVPADSWYGAATAGADAGQSYGPIIPQSGLPARGPVAAPIVATPAPRAQSAPASTNCAGGSQCCLCSGQTSPRSE